MPDDNPLIYHNPSCSKSREVLQILKANKIAPTIINYLEQPLARQELKNLVAMLDIPARELLRHTEPVYEDAGLDDDSLSEDEIIAAICEHPTLLQRPIVVANGRAVIGRPPTRVLDIIA